MKVTLRQAHKLVEKLSAKIATVAVTAQAAVSIWQEDIDPAALIQQKAVEYKQQLNRKLELMAVRQEIRSSIQSVNGVEVNGLVSARKSLLDQLAVLREALGTVSGINKPVELKGKLEAERTVAKAGTSHRMYASDSVTFCVLNDVEKDQLEKQIADLQLRVEAMEDQLTTTNAASSIVLTEHAVTVMRREGLVQ